MGLAVAAIYCRQSIEKEDSCSLDMQEHRCRALAQSMGWDVEVYKDPGKSGKNLDRPQFQRMMKDIKDGKIHTVIVYKLDRISRNLKDFFTLMEEFKEIGVGFRSISENFDTTTTIGRAVVGILAVFAQFERETLAERVRDNMYDRARMGMWNGGPVPMGFKVVKKVVNGKTISVLEHVEEDIKLVRDIFKKYLLPNMSAGRITKDFNDSGIRTPKNRYWNDNLVKRTLTNPIYCAADMDAYEYFSNLGVEIASPKEDFNGTRGLMVYNRRKPAGNTSKERDVKEWILAVGHHPPVVSGKDFVAVQKKIEARAWTPPRSNTGHRGLLATLVKCGKCGLSMTTSYTKKRKKDGSYTYYTYYKCTGRRRHICEGQNIRADVLNSIVIETINKIVDDPEFRRKQIETAKSELKDSTDELRKEIQRVKKALENYEQEEHNLITALGRGTIKIELIERRLAEIEKEKETLQEKLLKMEMELQEKGLREINIDVLVSNLERFKESFEKLTLDEKRALLQSLIYKIVVDDDRVAIALSNDCVFGTNGHGFIAATSIIRAG